MDIYLVNMPYAPVRRPSIAIGLLQAILKREGISVAGLHANLRWCERIGIRSYQLAENGESLLGEWTFARAAFPDFAPDAEAYLQRVFPDNYFIRLGRNRRDLAEISADIRRKAVQFVDELAGELVAHSPMIIGCSSTYAAHVSSLALLRRVRELAPDIVTIMGGANCETVMGLTTHEKFPWVDYVVSGEADGIIVDLVKTIRERGRDAGPNELHHGVIAPVHRLSSYADLREDPPRAISESLAGLPTPDYDDYFDALKEQPVLGEVVRPALPLEGSRGCWWGHKRQCTFCGLNGQGMKYRAKPSQQILEELDIFGKRYGSGQIGLTDNILNPGWFSTLFPQLAELNHSQKIFCETTPNLTRDRIRVLAQAGVSRLQPGIESLDPQTLTILNKGSKAWLNVRFLKWCLYYGIEVLWWLLDHVPLAKQDWYADARDLLMNLSHLQPPMRLNSILFSRFSRYHKSPEAYGLRLEPAEAYSLIYPLSEPDLRRIAYYFEHEDGAERSDEREDDSRINGERESLIEMLIEWHRLFYSDQRAILETTETTGLIHVRDTRPTAVETSFVLGDEERLVYLACENGIRPDPLQRKLLQRGIPASTTKRVVETLIEKKLVLFLDTHCLSLGTPKPRAEVPRGKPSRCGEIDEALYAALIRLGATLEFSLADGQV